MEGGKPGRIALRDNPGGEALILTTLALMALGAVMVFSTSFPTAAGAKWYYRRDVRQLLFATSGLLLLLLLWRLDYRWLVRRPWGRRLPTPAEALLVVGLCSAAAVLVFGRDIRGTLRFLQFGPVGFQPSEVLKFGVLVFLAGLLSRPGVRPRSFTRTFLPAVGLIGLGIALVVTQDFGTAAIIAIASAVLLLMGGVPWLYVLALLPLAAAGFYKFVVCDPHRWARITAFWDPFSTTNPSAYQPRQALIAVASGAAPAGVGGGVAKYGYLPEAGTDFIFAMICQELGAIGAGVVIALLLVWLLLAYRAARTAGDRLGALLAGGLGFLIGLQAVMHVAVNAVCLPPTGVSLPFVSAGGSSLLAMSAATAMIVSVSARKKMTSAERLMANE